MNLIPLNEAPVIPYLRPPDGQVNQVGRTLAYRGLFQGTTL